MAESARPDRVLRVVGAVIVRDGLVLCAQRGSGAQAGLWEFPGGKIEDGESPRAALVREIREELGCEVAVGDEVTTATHDYGFARVELTTFWCEVTAGHPVAAEHAALMWLRPGELDQLEWAPVDLPTVRCLGVSRRTEGISQGPSGWVRPETQPCRRARAARD